MNLEDKPPNLTSFVELITGENEFESRLRAGNRLKGSRIEKVLDPSERLGFWNKSIEAEPGHAEFHEWVATLVSRLRTEADGGNWTFRGMSNRSPTFPELESGYIRHSEIDLLRNAIGGFRSIEVTPRVSTVKNQSVRIMRALMVADPARQLTKTEIYESVDAALPGIRVSTLDDAWEFITTSVFPDYTKPGPRKHNRS